MKFEGLFNPRAGLQTTLSVNTGKGGLFECINFSVSNLIIFIPSLGNVLHPAQTMGIFPLVNAEIGTQTINITALQPTPLQAGEILVQPDYTNSAFFNSYQRGERQLYPPTPLNGFPLPQAYSNTASANSSGALGIINFNLQPPSPTPPLTNGYNVITGFDVGASSGALNRVGMTITNLLQTTLNYNIQCDPNQEFFLNKQFPYPGVLAQKNSAVVFNVPAGLASTQLALNVFFYQVFN